MDKETFKRLQAGFGYDELDSSIIVNPRAHDNFKNELDNFLNAMFQQAGEIQRYSGAPAKEAIIQAQDLMIEAEEYKKKAMQLWMDLGKVQQ